MYTVGEDSFGEVKKCKSKGLDEWSNRGRGIAGGPGTVVKTKAMILNPFQAVSTRRCYYC